MFNRRGFLQGFSSLLTLPLISKLLPPKAVEFDKGSKSQLLEPDRKSDLIKTGFPVLDDAMGGGLRRGEIFSIYGPTGSGKSAFVRSIYRNVRSQYKTALNLLIIDNLESKNISQNGFDVIFKHAREKQMAIGLVIQTRRIYSGLGGFGEFDSMPLRPMFCSDHVFELKKDDKDFSCTLMKNRYGRNGVVQQLKGLTLLGSRLERVPSLYFYPSLLVPIEHTFILIQIV